MEMKTKVERLADTIRFKENKIGGIIKQFIDNRHKEPVKTSLARLKTITDAQSDLIHDIEQYARLAMPTHDEAIDERALIQSIPHLAKLDSSIINALKLHKANVTSINMHVTLNATEYKKKSAKEKVDIFMRLSHEYTLYFDANRKVVDMLTNGV